MSCATGNCGGSTAVCTADLISPWMPPKGGWSVSGWPPGTPVAFQQIWHQVNGPDEPVWQGNSISETVGSINATLNASNGVSLDQAEVCQWVNEQYCERDPSRCATSQNTDTRLASQRSASYVAEPMQWATPFWKIWNVALFDGESRNDRTPAEVCQWFANIALFMTAGTLGCVNPCHKHFTELVAEYPIENIDSWRNARIWLWRIHNESRSNGHTVSYYEIAKINSWEIIEDEEVYRIIEEELRASA